MTPKPLCELKQPFHDSLDNLTQKAMFLVQIVDTALELEKINSDIAPRVRNALTEFKAALIGT